MATGKPHFTAEQKQQAIKRLKTESTIAVAKDIGADKSTVGKWARAAGLRVGRGASMKYTDEMKRTVVARIAAGESRKDVAADAGIDEGTITKWKQEAAASKETVKGKLRVKPYHPRRNWTDEEKRAAVERANNGEMIKLVAESMGTHPSLLTKWKKQFSASRQKRAYVKRAPELLGSSRPLEASVKTSIALIKKVLGLIDNTDPVHATLVLVMHTLEGKM